MKQRKAFEAVAPLTRPEPTEQQAEHARRVRARNDWLQRGRTGEPPEAVYGGRPPMEKKTDD
jgi:hypothetical protein